MPIVSLLSQKGGVGKTMCATNIAASLALHHGKRVCLIDLDEQASAAVGVGVNPPSARPPLGDRIRERKLVDCVFETPIKGLFAIPSDPSVNELYFAQTPMKERLLEFAIASIRDYFDWIVIDTPSGLGLWSWNAVYVSDLVVIPVQADEAAERAVRQTTEWMRSIVSQFRPGVSMESFFRLVMTIVDRDNRVLNELLRAFLAADFPDQALPVEIRKRAAVCQARKSHMPIFSFAEVDTSPGAREAVTDYQKLTEEIVLYGGEIEKRAAGRGNTRTAAVG